METVHPFDPMKRWSNRSKSSCSSSLQVVYSSEENGKEGGWIKKSSTTSDNRLSNSRSFLLFSNSPEIPLSTNVVSFFSTFYCYNNIILYLLHGYFLNIILYSLHVYFYNIFLYL